MRENLENVPIPDTTPAAMAPLVDPSLIWGAGLAAGGALCLVSTNPDSFAIGKGCWAFDLSSSLCLAIISSSSAKDKQVWKKNILITIYIS